MIGSFDLIIMLDLVAFLAAIAAVYLILSFRKAAKSGSLWRMSTATLGATFFFVMPFVVEFLGLAGIDILYFASSEQLKRLFELLMFVVAETFALFSYRELANAGGGDFR